MLYKLCYRLIINLVNIHREYIKFPVLHKYPLYDRSAIPMKKKKFR